MAQRPVTLADIVRGHVSLEIEGFNGWVPALQTSGQIAGWLHWRGFPIASPAALGCNAQAFRAAVRRYANGNQIPWVVFRKGDRKLEVVRPYLDAAERARRSEVVASGRPGSSSGCSTRRRRPAGRGAVFPVLPHRAAGDLLLLLYPRPARGGRVHQGLLLCAVPGQGVVQRA
jgi:hypothetical protein